MTDTPSLTDDLRRLEEIVRQMESDDVPLERALELFEEGIGRLRAAQARLADAETRVSQVLRDSSTPTGIRIEPLDG